MRTPPFFRIAAMALALAAPGLHADSLIWNAPSGGSYLDASNWTPSQTPGVADGTVFQLGSAAPYTVSLGEDTTNQSLWVVNDRLIFDLQGHSLALTSAAASGDSERGFSLATASGAVAEMTLQGGGSLTTQTFIAASVGSASAVLNVSGAGTTWTHQGNTVDAASLGWRGDAVLRVEAGASLLFNRLYMSRYVGSKAELIVTGADTTASFSNRLEMGYRGGSTLRVEQGATVTTLRLTMGGLGSSTKTTTVVNGASSLLDVTSTLNVGIADTTGTLTVENGGKLTVGGVTEIAPSTDTTRVGSGRLEVRGSGSRYEAGNAIHVAGTSGAAAVSSGTLLLADGGHLEGWQSAALHVYQNGTLSLAGDATFRVSELHLLEGADFTIELNSGLLLGDVRQDLAIGTDVALNLSLSTGFSANVGDSISLIRYGGDATGFFVGLSEGATFDAGGYLFEITYGSGSNDAIRLEVRAVPEPEPALALFGAALLLLVTRRFRRLNAR